MRTPGSASGRQVIQPIIAMILASMMISVVALASPSFASAPKKPVAMFYVSLGDSYAAGVEAGPGTGGYTAKVVTDVAPKHKLLLRNFACGGATTTSMMSVIGCSGAFDSQHGVPHPNKTQLAAAIGFIDSRIGIQHINFTLLYFQIVRENAAFRERLSLFFGAVFEIFLEIPCAPLRNAHFRQSINFVIDIPFGV